MDDGDDRRGVSPLVANILLVALALVLSVTLVVLSASFLEQTGAPTADARFEYERSAVGLEMRPIALGTDVVVRLNGNRVATFDADDSGVSKLIPTAPGDRIVVVSEDEDRAVLVEKEIDDRSEVGDFIAYYTFDERSDDTIADRSGNGNSATMEDDGGGSGPNRAGCGLRFDGQDDHVSVEDISSAVDVDEFTVAVTYNQFRPGSTDISQLIEHTWSGNEWFLETRYDAGRGTYRPEFAVEYPRQVIAGGYNYELREQRTVVGTYDGTDYTLYVDGNKLASGTNSREVNMGDMRIGRDFESNNQYFDGLVCEVRLYYSALTDEQVDRLVDAMP